MGGSGKRDETHPCEHPAPEEGKREVARVDENSAGSLDPGGARVREVRLLQQRQHVLDMFREPQVVVGQVAHDLASSLSQSCMTVNLSVPGTLRIVEESEPCILACKPLDDLASDVRHTIADHEDLDVLDRLPECRRDGRPEHRSVVEGRDHDRGTDPFIHRVSPEMYQ